MQRNFGRLAGAAVDATGPAWFTSVMGTGILAIGVMATPAPLPGRDALAAALWLLACAVFTTLCVLSGLRFARARSAVFARRDLATVQAWGAPPMAAFTVAVGFLTIGPLLLAHAACVAVAQLLFLGGAAGSVASAFAVPLRLFTEHDVTLENVNGTWLLPVVPPIVASVPAALLSPFWPAAARSSMLGLGYALLGLGIILAAIVIVIFFARLLVHKIPAPALVPAMWIVIGPLGQSIAGFAALGGAARSVWPGAGSGIATAGIAYGVVVWGFAMYWLALVLVVTARAMRAGIPFTMGWWAFTFPIGVLTAGTVALYRVTGAALYAVAGTLLIALLATLWSIVALHTLRAIASFSAEFGRTRGDGQRGRGAEHPVAGVA